MGQLAAQYVGSPTSLPSACPNVNLSGCSFVFTGNGIKAYVSNVSGNTVTLTVSKCITIAAGTLYVKETDACGAQVATSNFTAATTTTISFTANHTGSKTFVVTLNVGTGTVTRYYSNNITVTQLSAPSNVYPSDGQAFAYTTASSGVVLQWAKNNNAGLANYEVRLVNTTSGSTVFDYTNVGDINSTGVTSGLQVGNAYRWIVRILGTTLQSTATTFSIGSPPAVVQPTTTSPTNNYVYQTVPSSIQFTWLKNNGAGLCDYIVNLRDNTTGTLLVDDNSGNVGDSNTFSYYTFNAGHDYQWVVRARGKINTTDIKTTSAQLFSIKEPIPSVPTLSPTSGYANYINNAHQTYTELRLTVPPYTSKVRLQIANDDGANGYGYSAANGFSALRFYNGVSIPLNNLPSYVSLGSGQTASSIYNNGGTVIFRIPIGQTGYDLATAMPYGETFVYTAKCLNSIDETSNYCPVGYFRTMMPPAVFTAPPSSVCAGSDYNYTWVTVPSSKPLTAWRLQVAPENTAFNAETGLSSTSITFAETNTLTDISATRLNANGQLRLAPGRYICTMRWSNGTVESAFSAPRQFTVTCDAPMNLAGIEPSSTGFKATWNAVAGAVSYRISVYKNGAGAPSNYSSTTNEATFTTLLSGTNYSLDFMWV